MFLIEDARKHILYTGDIRAEDWWIESVTRQPAMVAYGAGHKRLDNLYLDTTCARRVPSYRSFPSKAAGMRSLLRQIAKHDADAVFHLRSWTFGYEEVWAAIAAAFSTKVWQPLLLSRRSKLVRSMSIAIVLTCIAHCPD